MYSIWICEERRTEIEELIKETKEKLIGKINQYIEGPGKNIQTT